MFTCSSSPSLYMFDSPPERPEYVPLQKINVRSFADIFTSPRYTNLMFAPPPEMYVPPPNVIGQRIMENCVLTSLLSMPIGYVAGVFMTLFFHHPNVDPNLSTREALRESWKEFIPAAKRSGKNFAYFGAIFHFSDCNIQKFRGKQDTMGGFLAGCTTGGLMSYQRGPIGMATSCVGFGIFSAGIEWFMHKNSLPDTE